MHACRQDGEAIDLLARLVEMGQQPVAMVQRRWHVLRLDQVLRARLRMEGGNRVERRNRQHDRGERQHQAHGLRGMPVVGAEGPGEQREQRRRRGRGDEASEWHRLPAAEDDRQHDGRNQPEHERREPGPGRSPAQPPAR